MANASTISDRDWQQYEYLVDCSITIPGKDTIELNDLQIEGVYIEKDFDNDHLPVLLLDLSISRLTELSIIKYMEETVFSLQIMSYIRDPGDPDVIMDKKILISGDSIPSYRM